MDGALSWSGSAPQRDLGSLLFGCYRSSGLSRQCCAEKEANLSIPPTPPVPIDKTAMPQKSHPAATRNMSEPQLEGREATGFDRDSQVYLHTEQEKFPTASKDCHLSLSTRVAEEMLLSSPLDPCATILLRPTNYYGNVITDRMFSNDWAESPVDHLEMEVELSSEQSRDDEWIAAILKGDMSLNYDIINYDLETVAGYETIDVCAGV